MSDPDIPDYVPDLVFAARQAAGRLTACVVLLSDETLLHHAEDHEWLLPLVHDLLVDIQASLRTSVAREEAQGR